MNDNNPYLPLHMVADAAILLIEKYHDGRKFYDGINSLILHLMYLERFIDSGRASLGDPNNPRQENEDSFQSLVNKIDQIRNEISDIGKHVDPLSEAEFRSMNDRDGYKISEWYKNLSK